ncbi:hypothetical protein [Sanguibacter sp. Z1732]|uniref:YobI family P-loop NTPase n=1 Tax=Sanguibacter sp. Z1732 TaxID=3435412 RepID=UPI003D9C8453
MTDPQNPDQDAPASTVLESGASLTAESLTPDGFRHELRSLASLFQVERHGTYVEHLERVVEDVKNRNVALTGRYGTGKSSVLDEFEDRHQSRVLRVTITTLGPDRDGEGLTNRIQKELVKQLIYRTEPGELRSSRFARTDPDPIASKYAWLQTAVATAVLGLFLGLGGWLPDVAAFPDDLSWTWRSVGAILLFVLAWLLFYGAATTIAWWLRMAADSRIITSLSTAGASITLGERDDTYFDTYLDELVTYFDRGNEDYVILEDLDRFDDPAIFDSLRELNTILNASPGRGAAAPDRQLCFIYAIKDSLFERLVEPEPEEKDDRGKAEAESRADDEKTARPCENAEDRTKVQREVLAERANRTKFFDVVIPMVPFLSHRNARDVLEGELAKRSIPTGTVSRALLSLVARYVTDMRLLLNILNEFTVYAQRLLWVNHPAPELTGDRLFALVVYKNFRLADFEAVPTRKSALDDLDRAHRRWSVTPSLPVRLSACRPASRSPRPGRARSPIAWAANWCSCPEVSCLQTNLISESQFATESAPSTSMCLRWAPSRSGKRWRRIIASPSNRSTGGGPTRAAPRKSTRQHCRVGSPTPSQRGSGRPNGTPPPIAESSSSPKRSTSFAGPGTPTCWNAPSSLTSKA